MRGVLLIALCLAVPLPPVEFTNEIRVNVSKKVAERKEAVIVAQASREHLNSAWVKGKDHHIVYAAPLK